MNVPLELLIKFTRLFFFFLLKLYDVCIYLITKSVLPFISGVSRVWLVGQGPWGTFEVGEVGGGGGGRHSTGLFLTYATRLTF